MLKHTLQWRADYQPEMIGWKDVASEAETGIQVFTSLRDSEGSVLLVTLADCPAQAIWVVALQDVQRR
ncbi:hypothetical protein WJX81_003888 [Elliptochloris bilobata]|uniref:Uncharacterized protein n=1 Tax=Elliptochloris bilobata TaxID=381761 RepID=A0AAW1S8U7_9CHLO